jgi:hypothetical protein
MQAALMLRSKTRSTKQKRLIKGKWREVEMPSNLATCKELPPYPQFPPELWV